MCQKQYKKFSCYNFKLIFVHMVCVIKYLNVRNFCESLHLKGKNNLDILKS